MLMQEPAPFPEIAQLRQGGDEVYVVRMRLGAFLISSRMGVPVIKSEQLEDQHIGWRRHAHQEAAGLRRSRHQQRQIDGPQILRDETGLGCKTTMQLRSDQFDPPTLCGNPLNWRCQDVELLSWLLREPETPAVIAGDVLQLIDDGSRHSLSCRLLPGLRTGDHQVDVLRGPNHLRTVLEQQVDAQTATNHRPKADSVEGLCEFP